MASFLHYSIFSRNPKCPGSYFWGYAYLRLEITALEHPLVRRDTEMMSGYKESLSYTAFPNKHAVTRFPGIRRL
jgi:hypothetical protein